MTPIAARGAPLEYWFVKLNAPGLAFLVDLIVRRRQGRAEVRLSYWRAGAGTVTHEYSDRWTADANGIRTTNARITSDRCSGESMGVAWDLAIRLGPRWLDPGRPVAWLRAADLQIVSSPASRFDGTIRIDGSEMPITGARGLVAHYWGRRLPDRWVWLSLNTEHRDVDALLARTRLWGLRWPQMEMGYLYAADPRHARLVISPLNGLVSGSVHDGVVSLRARGIDGEVRVRARTPAAARNDLGEEITQTLLGDLEIDGENSVGIAGVETRGWPL